MFARIKNLRVILFHNRSQGQTIFKNFSWLFLGHIVSRLFRGLVIIYAARALGTTEYGVFSYALGLAGFFAIFTDIGINPIITKEIAQNEDRGRQFFATGFWIKIFLLLFTAVLVTFVAPFFSKIEGAEALLPLVALLIAFDGIREFFIAYFRAKERMELEALLTAATNISIAAFGLIILYINKTAYAISLTYVLSAGAGMLLGAFVLHKELRGLVSSFTKTLLRPILTLAWPVAFTSLASIFMMNVDIVMLGFFKSADAVGLYSAGQRIIQLIYFLPSIIAVSTYPAISKMVGEKNDEGARGLIEKGLTASFLVAIPLAVGGVILGSSIISFLYGPAYASAVPSFRVLLLTALLVFPGYHFSNYILAHNKQNKAVALVAYASLTNLILNALFIPRFGIVGAAVATLIALIVLHGLSWRLAKKTSYFTTFTHLKKIIFASLCMGVLSFGMDRLGLNVIANISLSVVFYFVLLYILKENTIWGVRTLLGKNSRSAISPPPASIT